VGGRLGIRRRIGGRGGRDCRVVVYSVGVGRRGMGVGGGGWVDGGSHEEENHHPGDEKLKRRALEVGCILDSSL